MCGPIKTKNREHEKLVRNIGKFQQAEHYFNMASKALEERMTIQLKKLD